MIKMDARLPALASLLILSACGEQAFVYDPGAAVVQEGSLFTPRSCYSVAAPESACVTVAYPVKAAISDIPALTPAASSEGGYADLTRQGAPGWPRFSPERISLILAGELAKSGLVASAEVLPDETGTGFGPAAAARSKGERLFISGSIEEASLTYTDALTGRYVFKLRLTALIPEGSNPQFSGTILDKEYELKAQRRGRPPAIEVDEDLERLYAGFFKDLEKALEKLQADHPAVFL